MSELEEKLGAILSNPQMMQQISQMAQAMSAGGANPAAPPSPAPAPAPAAAEAMAPSTAALPALDPRLLSSLAGMARQSGIDQNEQTLLKALYPYLSRNRVQKLERAMRAAKMAGLASGFLNSGALQMLTGR